MEVEADTPDGFFKDGVGDSRLDLIKIDVQGAEDLITSNKLKIFMEFWPAGLENVGTDPAGLLRRMQGYGFHIQHIDES
ncbi:MAG: FkbM family methyltransferase, partial [Actinobacteria bacterium]|nr:FkbM family methyltransferase [Actinomycetota bacterium]